MLKLVQLLRGDGSVAFGALWLRMIGTPRPNTFCVVIVTCVTIQCVDHIADCPFSEANRAQTIVLRRKAISFLVLEILLHSDLCETSGQITSEFCVVTGPRETDAKKNTHKVAHPE